MTHEGQGPGPEDTPAPASTRWDAGSTEDDDALLPPYIPGRQGGESETRADQDAELAPGGPWPEEDPAPSDSAAMPGGAGGDEDEFPFEAFDLAGAIDSTFPMEEESSSTSGARSEVEDFTLPEPAGAEEAPFPRHSTAGGAASGSRAAAELADRLEEAAARLREDGRRAVERDLASSDRFTSLLAGILAGYLAARND